MQLDSILCEFGQIYATGNAPMKLESILCEFGQIYATGNTLVQLESILCEFGQIYATGNALMLLDSILCEFGQIYVAGTAPILRNSILNFSRLIPPSISRTFHGTSWKLTEQSQKQGRRKRLISQPRGLPQTCLRNRVCFRPRPTTPTHQLPPGWPQSPDSPSRCSPIN